MKLFNKKISIGTGLAILFAVASGVYSLGYKCALEKFNRVVSSTQEKQRMYGSLSEIDYNIKNEYIGSVDEEKILNGIYRGYILGLEDEECKLLSRDEYNSYVNNKENLSAEVSWDELDNSVGYLRCGILGRGSSDMILERIKYFNLKEIKKIILDFRMSTDGIMEEGFKVLQELLPKGDLIKKINKNGDTEIVCKSEGSEFNLDIVVITSRKTSGVSEILACALKDFLSSKIIGEKTLGNNTKKRAVDIAENLVMIFPDGKYITNHGTDIYKKGLLPDQTLNISEDEENLFFNSNLPYSRDVQLQSAMELLRN